MKFKKGTRRRAIEYEKDLVSYWKKNKIFEQSVEMRPKSEAFVFYDGPPFITGVPHHGTLLSSIVKDAIPRYQTMKGKRVERIWGWDCHGLPAENYVEQKLGIKDKRDVAKVGLETYINTCRDSMVQTGNLWEDTIDRIGRWVEFKGAYKTMDKPYMESVWWAFKELYNKRKIYEGERVLLYCTRCATPISKSEVAMDNSYQDVTDPSVYVKFKLVGENTSLLAWTTTPWTLPANTAAAVNKNVEYVEVEVDGEHLILAKALLNKVLTDEKHNILNYNVVKNIKGSELVGKVYEPLFTSRGKNAHTVYHADYVSTEDGTGIVHLAPAYGEEDYDLAKEKKFPVVSNIDDNGFYNEGDWVGLGVWDSNKQIAKDLHAKSVVWKIDYICHSYPHCHRCGTKLMYRAHPSWFMDIEGQRQEMLEQNSNITWFPEHIKHGRFEKTIQSAPDWNLSRDRFWATPMPVWKATDKDGVEHVKVVGSYDELKELSGKELEDYHLPWVDEITFKIDGLTYKRIDKVLDCWFESGSMPFAQFHYPFENVEKFEQNFPGDFIAEYVGQVRAWFYYLHVISVGLFGKEAFKNVIVTGTVAGNDGRKMSKSYGNFTDPNKLMDTYSADSLRFLLLQSPLLNGEDFALIDKDVADIARKLGMIWNMYDFFTLYAEVDKWEWSGKVEDPLPQLTNQLDIWVVSRLHQLIAEMTTHLDNYDIPKALKPVVEFIDDASNWYVRRSRKRFWKSDNDTDKSDAYATLHYVLVQLATVLAPFTPFLSEELYRNLTGDKSVHLRDWPSIGRVNEIAIQEMAEVRELITEGLSQRASAAIKVRQPLANADVTLSFDAHTADKTELIDILAEELNVKKVSTNKGTKPMIVIDTHITEELTLEGISRDVVRYVQESRKKAGLDIDDRIELELTTDDTLVDKAITMHKSSIYAETLTVVEAIKGDNFYKDTVKINNAELTVKLKKA